MARAWVQAIQVGVEFGEESVKARPGWAGLRVGVRRLLAKKTGNSSYYVSGVGSFVLLGVEIRPFST